MCSAHLIFDLSYWLLFTTHLDVYYSTVDLLFEFYGLISTGKTIDFYIKFNLYINDEAIKPSWTMLCFSGLKVEYFEDLVPLWCLTLANISVHAVTVCLPMSYSV